MAHWRRARRPAHDDRLYAAALHSTEPDRCPGNDLGAVRRAKYQAAPAQDQEDWQAPRCAVPSGTEGASRRRAPNGYGDRRLSGKWVPYLSFNERFRPRVRSGWDRRASTRPAQHGHDMDGARRHGAADRVGSGHSIDQTQRLLETYLPRTESWQRRRSRRWASTRRARKSNGLDHLRGKLTMESMLDRVPDVLQRVILRVLFCGREKPVSRPDRGFSKSDEARIQMKLSRVAARPTRGSPCARQLMRSSSLGSRVSS
jgi:hypothetical protein